MIKKLKQVFVSVFALAMIATPFAFVGVASAQGSLEDCSGIAGCLDTGSCAVDDTNCNGTDAGSRVNDIIKLVINIFSLIVGVIAVIMIIIGGLKYITSGGDSGNVSGAKNTILYAVIGLVIVALAQIIVRFVLQKVTGTTAG